MCQIAWRPTSRLPRHSFSDRSEPCAGSGLLLALVRSWCNLWKFWEPVCFSMGTTKLCRTTFHVDIVIQMWLVLAQLSLHVGLHSENLVDGSEHAPLALFFFFFFLSFILKRGVLRSFCLFLVMIPPPPSPWRKRFFVLNRSETSFLLKRKELVQE